MRCIPFSMLNRHMNRWIVVVVIIFFSLLFAHVQCSHACALEILIITRIIIFYDVEFFPFSPNETTLQLCVAHHHHTAIYVNGSAHVSIGFRCIHSIFLVTEGKSSIFVYPCQPQSASQPQPQPHRERERSSCAYLHEPFTKHRHSSKLLWLTSPSANILKITPKIVKKSETENIPCAQVQCACIFRVAACHFTTKHMNALCIHFDC